jgi:hypothetical protein
MSTIIPPVCPYCNERVGDNEFDVESQGYFSSHFRCATECPQDEATHYVSAYFDGELRGSHWYRNERAATGRADHLASHNTARWTFLVFDLIHDSPRADYDGRVKTPA